MVSTKTPQKTQKTRLLLLSDTHSIPLFPADDPNHPFKSPLPAADILLHMGDLTNTGRPDALRDALYQLAQIPAELKLVIAGNHDATLDAAYWRSQVSRGGGRDPRFGPRPLEEAAEAREIWKQEAAALGVTCLEEGTFAFELRSGVRFVVYASPFQPEFMDWAFAYERGEDRYNAPGLAGQPVASEEGQPYVNIAANPVPSVGEIDIMMTHGPPKRRLDLCPGGFVGCEHLLRAVRRAKPRLHCFGHIHEGWGAEVVSWAPEDEEKVDVGSERVNNGHGQYGMQREGQNEQGKGQDWAKDGIASIEPVRTDRNEMMKWRAAYVDVSAEGSTPVVYGEQTLMVNAAIMNGRFRPMNSGWLIDLDLPMVQEWDN